jgi:hypothetical protein
MPRLVRAAALLIVLAPNVVLGAIQYDRILIPLAVRNLQGSHGSVWTVSAWVANLSNEAKDFQTDEQCFAILCPPFALAGGAARPIAFQDQPPDNPGLVVYFESPGTAGTIQLLAKDLSRQALTAGTEIPIARESQFRSGRLRFLRVPVEARFPSNASNLRAGRSRRGVGSYTVPGRASARDRKYATESRPPDAHSGFRVQTCLCGTR